MDTFAGAIGATSCVYAGLPFDVIKVRLQTSPSLYRGTWHAFSTIISTQKQNCFKTLWKGAVPALCSAWMENAVLFTCNGYLTRLVLYNNNISNSDDPQEKSLNILTMATIGGLSGFVSATAITPAEVIKVRLQVQKASTKKHPVVRPMSNCIRRTWRKEGGRGFFRGLNAVWLRDVPFNFFFFGTYEGYSALYRKVCDYPPTMALSPGIVYCTGGLAGMTAWGLVFPADVLKSRLQSMTHNMSLFTLANKIVQEQGIIGFYKGWSAAVLRAFPANGALFLGYEMTCRVWKYLENRH